MKIIVLESSRHGVEDIALPFETDEQIVDAWDWIIGNGKLREFSYRPHAEGDDPNRAFIEKYLADLDSGVERRPLKAELIQRLFGSIYGAELHHRVMDLYDPQPALKIARS